jgi:hypothetical protein
MGSAMLNYEALANSIPESKLYIGMALSEAMTNAYLVAKGVRDVSISHLWGVNHPNLIEAIGEYCEVLSKDCASRSVSIKQYEFSLIIFADSAAPKADAVFKLVSRKPNISDLEASCAYTRELGLLLGYEVSLIDSFVAKVLNRAKKRK